VTNPVTYSLAPNGLNSEEYYHHVREFTDEVMERASVSLMPAAEDFMAFIGKYRLEDLRTPEEYVLDLLSFGLLWNSYAGYALAVRTAPFVTLARMAEWRKRHQKLKPAIDLARGILVTLFLLPRRGDRTPRSMPELRDVDRLCLWLEATGEFKEQALRFIRWRAYWDSMPAPRWQEGCTELFAFVDWFAARSEQALGDYTANIEPFLAQSHSRYRWREDRIQCTRSRVEYHFNMVGAEIMSRAFRPDFITTETKSILVPGCMRGRLAGECKAVKVREGLKCEGCLAECRVNQLREMGKKRGFDTYIIPHASDLSLWASRPDEPPRGVVAVACVPTLVEGGWELKRYGAIAQCVLLDYSGCKKHWHNDGVPTKLNIRELKRIMEC
jgi:hypothetical protein